VLRVPLLSRSPISVVSHKLVKIDTPEDFRDDVKTSKIDVLPLVPEGSGDFGNGWTTYVQEFPEAPELEVISGGVNHKSAKAGAIWRQGHLLHFAFSPGASEFNEAGRALLINSICYIARFTEDRPIVRTPCTFISGKRIVDRGVVDRVVENPKRDLDTLKYFLSEKTWKPFIGKDRATVAQWNKGMGQYLHAVEDGRLEVDPDALEFGQATNELAFLTRASAALNDPKRSKLARSLLTRYVPEGPGPEADVERWRIWVDDNKAYLFFSDAGGYRWYLDPLAKKRGVPSAQLRGTDRATLPEVTRGTSAR
jgi:hypothetical protein